MAELPEIDTLRRDLDREITGKRIRTVEVPGNGVIPRHGTKKQFTARLEGAKITGVGRRDLLLLIKLDTDDLLVVDLQHGGQVRRNAVRDPMAKNTRVVVTFTQGGQLRFVDDVGGLELFVLAGDQLVEAVPELAELGIDPLDEPMSWTTFGEMVLRRRARLRALLLDRTLVAGIGPVYADEVLHAAGLRYDRTSESLSTQEIRRLYRSLVETLHEAAKHRGVTLADGVYGDLNGKPGGWTDELKVYEREGQACRRCRSVVAKVRVGGKVTYLCEACQV
jgi:formamidopyrimidine-DNA glycosylase